MKHFTKFSIALAISFLTILVFTKSSEALIYPYNATYSGGQEVPPAITPATGTIMGTYDDVTKIITVDLTFSGLVGPTTNAHFHGPAPVGVNAAVIIGFVPAGFPLGVTSGALSTSFPVTPLQESYFFAGTVYANIHTSTFPGGELRAQINLDAPLPVELASFVSVIHRNDVTLKWSTSSETNNAGFEIERSSANSDWAKIGFVNGNGNSNTENNYAYADKSLATGNYSYRLKQLDYNGNYEYFNLSNEVNVGVPAEFRLSQNYPNPFNPSTKIDFDITSDANVNITLYDISGREVKMLVNEFKPAGYYSVTFNSTGLSSGAYFYRITSGNFTDIKKMILMK